MTSYKNIDSFSSRGRYLLVIVKTINVTIAGLCTAYQRFGE
jgi:hypothetical protein